MNNKGESDLDDFFGDISDSELFINLEGNAKTPRRLHSKQNQRHNMAIEISPPAISISKDTTLQSSKNSSSDTLLRSLVNTITGEYSQNKSENQSQQQQEQQLRLQQSTPSNTPQLSKNGQDEFELLRSRLAQLEKERDKAIGEAVIYKTSYEKLKKSHEDGVSEMKVIYDRERLSHEEQLEKLQHEVEAMKTERNFMMTDVQSLNERCRSAEKQLRLSQAASHRQPINKNRNIIASQPETPTNTHLASNRYRDLATTNSPSTQTRTKQTPTQPQKQSHHNKRDFDSDSEDESHTHLNHSTPLSDRFKKHRTDLGASFKDGFTDYFSSQRKRKNMQNIPDRASHLKETHLDMISKDFYRSNLEHTTNENENQNIDPKENTLLNTNVPNVNIDATTNTNKNTPEIDPLNHSTGNNNITNQNKSSTHTQNKIESIPKTKAPKITGRNTNPLESPEVTNLLNQKEKQIDSLNLKALDGWSVASTKQSIISFIEMLLGHFVYGNFYPSWELLSHWSIPDIDSSTTIPISRILESSLFQGEEVESISLSQIVSNFLERCKFVISQCYKYNNYRPIPIILQLIHYTVDFHPESVLLEISITSFLCEFLELHLDYIKALPNADSIYSSTYNPFKLSDASHSEITPKPDSSIACNDAFKEMSIIFVFDILENISCTAGFLGSESYRHVWSDIPFSIIISLLSYRTPSNILLKITLSLLSSVSETTIGPIHPDPALKKHKSIISKQQRERQRQNSPIPGPDTVSRTQSRSRSLTPGLMRSITPVLPSMSAPNISNINENSTKTPINQNNHEYYSSIFSKQQQARDENELISALSQLLTRDMSSRHILLFAGLENISSSHSISTTNGTNSWSHTFNYIYFNDINIMYPENKSSASFFPPPFRFHSYYRSENQYHHELTEINSATILFMRRVVIKFFFLIAVTKSPKIITQNSSVMVSIIQCMSRHLDLVYQSVEPDPAVVALISDCVNLLYSLWEIQPSSSGLTSTSTLSSSSSDHSLVNVIAGLPHGVGHELVISMARIGFSNDRHQVKDLIYTSHENSMDIDIDETNDVEDGNKDLDRNGNSLSDDEMANDDEYKDKQMNQSKRNSTERHSKNRNKQENIDQDENDGTILLKLLSLSPPPFSTKIIEKARKVLEYNVTDEEADFIYTQMSNDLK